MATPKRKAPKSKPVTQHQLFPAVVALWFGALFGLGSLAVRPSLLEEFVIKSRIDLLIQAAAPPLGMTARMLIALVMAALGAVIGVRIAQRLARPRQAPRERKRTNLSTRDEGASAVSAYADASTRYPGPAAGDAAAAATPGALAGRRRSLAIEHEEGYFVPHDNVPLPGSAPQIFDIAVSGLSDAPAPPAAAVELGSYAEQARAATPVAVALDWANAAPVLPPTAQIAAAAVPIAMAPVQPGFAPRFAAEDQRQVFGAVPPAIPPVDQPRQIFGAPVTDDHVPKEFVEAQGFRTSVFVAPEPSPLFPARLETLPVAAEPAAAQPEVALAVAYAPPVETAAFAAVIQPAVAETASAPAPPSPASLGIEDLSSRLAESMRRRRAARAGVPAVVAVEPAAVPQAFAPAVPALQAEPEAVPAAATEAPAAAEPIPAALRPLDLNGFEEDDDLGQDSLLPPRRIAFPVEVAPAGFTPPVSVPTTGEPEVAEENYASLLGVTPSPASLRNPFVRVEEPDAETETVEPVVIFPGQAMPAANPFTATADAGAHEATPFRRFDAPANAGHGQPIAANEAANAMPREEAELALRSALANLQRMSGAA